MKNKFWEKLDHKVLHEASIRFRTSEDKIKKIGESTNLVYEYEYGVENLILR